MSEWNEYKLEDVSLINPTESLKKGIVAKKIAMEVLNPFSKKIKSFAFEPYNGGVKFKNGDTLIARITPSLENGKTSYVDILENDEIAFGSTEFIVLREKKGVTDRNFLYYLAISSEFREVAIKSMTGSSGRQRVQTEVVKEHKFLLPPLPEQRAIASILSSLDDKIDLLHRQNATLEKMAETLFRQWFVVEAKEEWEEGTLDDVLTVKGGTTPSTSNPAYWDGTIHWTSPRDITNLNGIYLFDTERKITELGLAKISSGLLPIGTLIMSSRAPVGVLAFSEVPVAINQGYIAILDNKGYSKEFIYLWLKINIDTIHSFSNGSTFMEISKSAFKTLQIQIPPKNVLVDFQIAIKPLFNKIKSNQTQIRTLTTLRDTLLPKLMSGEVRVDIT